LQPDCSPERLALQAGYIPEASRRRAMVNTRLTRRRGSRRRGRRTSARRPEHRGRSIARPKRADGAQALSMIEDMTVRRLPMPANARVTITLSVELVRDIARLEKNRSRFLQDAARHELERRPEGTCSTIPCDARTRRPPSWPRPAWGHGRPRCRRKTPPAWSISGRARKSAGCLARGGQRSAREARAWYGRSLGPGPHRRP
jgi:hypothetical protein